MNNVNGGTTTGGTVYQSGYWHADFHQTQNICFPFYYALQAQEANDATYPLLCPDHYYKPSWTTPAYVDVI